MKNIFISLILLLFSYNIYSQRGFRFYGKEDVKQHVKFKLINNLIVIPLEINGKELSFVLDTGVNKTILFNLTKNDSLGLNSISKIELRGLGSGEPVEAYLSKNNRFKIKSLISSNQDLYIILKDGFNMSSKMGITIHGIIGYDLLKSVIAKINYNQKVITFYSPEKYTYKKCKKCEEFPLEFYRNKPYINTKIQIDTTNDKLTDVKLLIDSGGSDAVWLFEDTHKDIKTPKKYFLDILGEGLSGTIYGNRSKIPKIYLGDFEIKKPTVSFLDSASTFNARKFRGRNGSIGGNVLKRFKVWIDYPNEKITFKKSSSLKKGFYYNMSGLTVVYNGQQLIKEENASRVIDSYGSKSEASNNKTVSFITSYSYKFKSSYKVETVLKDSPADKAGIKPEDIIRKINGKYAHNLTLNEINDMFINKPNKRINIEVERLGMTLKFEFKLKERI
ncbi:aspartyl protease family protein [Tenacibaculum geojense]|uniref:Aspartyl protease family protein n=1 Tax=Tenacibaculum geojense TaxID=915352 RepID=A0ABW3JTC4_9FLAO